ncbi:MAG: hypothetical protein HY981_03515 [Candidatus Magasanikbacteria bacterium]|nr:hypothetical protein [Candidatus Magasanikbacteria bacterium]
MRQIYAFLRTPDIGLQIAGAPHQTLAALPTTTQKVFERLYRAALYFKSNKEAPRAPVITELLQTYLDGHDAASYYAQLPAAIVEIHEYFADFVRFYLPRDLRQLFTSEGIITNIDDPADLVVSIFFPHEIHGNGRTEHISRLAEIRSWIALRTWFCAVRWLTERSILQRGRDHMQRITAAFEDDVFEACERDRMRVLNITYDPHRFTFRGIAHTPNGKTTIAMPLSIRRIDIKGSPVEVIFDSRVKSPHSVWRKISASRRLADHLAEMLIFFTEDDFKKTLSMLNRVVLHDETAKVKNGTRVDSTPNLNAFTYAGVFWSGTIHLGGVASELECSSIERYFNSMAGLNLFNHLAYEVRRLIRQSADGSPSLWEMIFPAALYTPLTLDLKIKMIVRQLASVAQDFYPHDQRARVEIDRVSKLLLAHPNGVDDPLSVRGLIRI